MIEDANIRYDSENNKIIIPLSLSDQSNKDEANIHVSTVIIRNVLPLPAENKDKIAELQQLIHEIHKDKLVNIRNYIQELHRLSDGEESARNKMEKCDNSDIKRWAEIGKTWMNQKNILREIRYAIRLLDEEEKRVNTMIAKIDAGIM